MKKILFESSSFTEQSAFSGVGYYSKILSEALQTQFQVDTVPGPFRKTVLNKIYRKLASYRIAPPYNGSDTPYDLVIFPNFATWPTTKAKYRAVVIHDLTYLKFPDSVSSKNLDYLRRVVPQSIKTCDIVITVSSTIQQELVETFDLDPKKVLVTPIPPKPGFGGSPLTEIHEKYSLPTEKYFLFIGNMEPRKNIGSLLNAYRSLPADVKKECALVLGGSKGWNSEKYQEMLNEAMASGENIRHVGYIDEEDIETFYKKAHFFVFPSVYEGFGMPILESLACNTPVISSDIPVFRETMGDAGVYFDPNNEQSITDSLLSTTQNESRKDILEAQLSVLDGYTWRHNIELIEDAISQ